jgi:hypothetical protein
MTTFENISIIIEEDTEIQNQPYDYSSPVSDEKREEAFRPPFMSPNPQSPKRNKNTFIPSILSKRKFEDAFDMETFDDERYGQHITNDFFVKSHGHNVHYTPIYKNVVNSIHDVNELLEWSEKYLASKKKL